MPLLPSAGTSPASAYALLDQAAQEQPPTILADAIDPVTGEYLSLTRGHSLADGFAVQAVRVQRGTGASVRELGNRFRELSHADAGTATVAESMVREAFAAAREAGVADLVSVDTEVDEADGSQLNVAISYRDLSAPRETSLRRLVFSRR